MPDKITAQWKVMISTISAGLAIGVIFTFFNISLSALIFKGTLTPYLADGISLLLSGTVVLVLFTGIWSSLPRVIGYVQEVPVSILALLAADIAFKMQNYGGEQIYATVLGAIIVSTGLTAIFFWILGHLHLGQLIRFVPYPVIGGFLAGTGWMLLTGAIQVMSGTTVVWELIDPALLMRWVPGLFFSLLILVALRRGVHFLFMPLLILGAIALFYGVLWMLGVAPAAALANDWLLGPLPTGRLWDPTALFAIREAEWAFVFLEHLLSLAAIPLISALALLLNASALEVALGQEADLNQELRVGGVTNLLAMLVGSPTGFMSVSATTLGQRMGAQGRLVSVVFATFLVVTLFFGAALLAYIPRMVVGGLLCYLGVTFLVEWLYDAWLRLPKIDNLLIWGIMIAITLFGFLSGVAIGILVAAVLFVVNYSQVNAVRHSYSRMDYPSYVSRPWHHEHLLRKHGEQIIIEELQGYLFFGTAQKLFTCLRTQLDERASPQPTHLLLDFRLVTGMDSSVTLSFQRFLRYLQEIDVQLVLTNLSPALQRSWERSVDAYREAVKVRLFPTLDQGLAWCEDQLLQTLADQVTVAGPLPLVDLLRHSLHGFCDTDQRICSCKTTGFPTKYQTTTCAEIGVFFNTLPPIVVEAGETLIHLGERLDGLFYVEDGEMIAQTNAPDGDTVIVRRMQQGAIFGEISFYTAEGASVEVVGHQASKLYQLNQQKMAELEQTFPTIALALHRTIARDLSHKLVQSTHALRVLKR